MVLQHRTGRGGGGGEQAIIIIALLITRLIIVPYRAAGCMVTPLAVSARSAKVPWRPHALGERAETRIATACRTTWVHHPPTGLNQYGIDVRWAVRLQLVQLDRTPYVPDILSGKGE